MRTVNRIPGLSLRIVLPAVQLVLIAAAVTVDYSRMQGGGEGGNQIAANLLSNVEFMIKTMLGYDDIVNYRFRPATAAAGLIFWFAIGLAADRIRLRTGRRRVER